MVGDRHTGSFGGKHVVYMSEQINVEFINLLGDGTTCIMIMLDIIYKILIILKH